MTPVIFEVQCNLLPDSPEWNKINSMRLEVGYPAGSGEIIWKHIAWLHDQMLPSGKSIVHALWDQATAGLVLIFDFLAVLQPGCTEPDRTYRIRKHIVNANGRLRTSKSRALQGDYKDEHFSLKPRYPVLKTD